MKTNKQKHTIKTAQNVIGAYMLKGLIQATGLAMLSLYIYFNGTLKVLKYVGTSING